MGVPILPSLSLKGREEGDKGEDLSPAPTNTDYISWKEEEQAGLGLCDLLYVPHFYPIIVTPAIGFVAIILADP